MKLYNTLSRKKEELIPLEDSKVRIYTCGPTVYHYAHIGNLRGYIMWDVLKRVLRLNKLRPFHVMNITDVGHLTSDADIGEDKMEKGSRREGKSVWDVAEFYTNAFLNDLKELNIDEPDIIPKATDHIKEQIEMIKSLEKKKLTYTTSDGVYFDTSQLKDYGKLAKLKIEGLEAGKRIELGEKRNPTDFALWKFSPKNEKRQMEWNSPWGVGFPGWHIECSAMAIKYLGEHFDIHCGGIDHIPVHHTNEIAQSEPLVGAPWVKVWLHNEFVVVKDEKMAKSEGNILTIAEIKKQGYDPLAYRYMVLNTHYRVPLNFSFEGLSSAQNSLEHLRERIVELLFEQDDSLGSKKKSEFLQELYDALSDDLNTPKAMGVVWEVLSSNDLGSKEKYEFLIKADELFGLRLSEIKIPKLSTEQQNLLDRREAARKAKNFKLADELRDELKKKGILIEDSKKGIRWKRL